MTLKRLDRILNELRFESTKVFLAEFFHIVDFIFEYCSVVKWDSFDKISLKVRALWADRMISLDDFGIYPKFDSN